MKHLKRKTSMIIVLIIFSTMIPVRTVSAMSVDDIVMDGYYTDWSNKPHSWEYPDSSGGSNDLDTTDSTETLDNNDTLTNTYNNVSTDSVSGSAISSAYNIDSTDSIDNTQSTISLDSSNGTDNINNKHHMSLLTNGEYVYLHIQLATKVKAGMNGQDFRFYLDNQEAVFTITYVGGEKVVKKDNHRNPGVYIMEVRHSVGTMNGDVVSGAEARYTINHNNNNNELELKIPLSAMKYQNNNIDLENLQQIAFFCPHLMHRWLICSGVSTAPYLGILICGAFVGGVFIINRRKLRSKKT